MSSSAGTNYFYLPLFHKALIFARVITLNTWTWVMKDKLERNSNKIRIQRKKTTILWIYKQYLAISCWDARASYMTVVAGVERREETLTLLWQDLICRHHRANLGDHYQVHGAEGFPPVEICFGHCGCGHLLFKTKEGFTNSVKNNACTSLLAFPVLREANPGLLNIFRPKDYSDMLWLILKEWLNKYKCVLLHDAD